MITLYNDFHNTEVDIHIQNINEGETIKISKSTYYKIYNKLCGIKDCLCGISRNCKYNVFKCDGDYYIQRLY